MLIWVLNVQWALSGAVAVRQGTPKAATTNKNWGVSRKPESTPEVQPLGLLSYTAQPCGVHHAQ
jgi:hypothetical protein